MANVIAVVDALAAPDPSPVPLRDMWWQRSVGRAVHWLDRLSAAEQQGVNGAAGVLHELRRLPPNVIGPALNRPVPLWCLQQDDSRVLVAGAALAACDAGMQQSSSVDRAIAACCATLGSPLALVGAGCWLDPASATTEQFRASQRAMCGARSIALASRDAILAGGAIDSYPKLEASSDLDTFGAVCGEAFSMLQASTPGFSRAMEGCLSCVIPMEVPEKGIPSASTNSVPGAVCVTATRDAALVAEQLTHEVSHAHLFVLQETEPLLEPASHGDGWGEPFVYSPWRDDARPLNGLLHGAVVFSRVAWLHAGMADRIPTCRRRLAAIGPQVRAALADLTEHATMTPPGKRLLRGLAESAQMLGSICNEWSGELGDPMYLECSSILREHGPAHVRQQAHRARCASGISR